MGLTDERALFGEAKSADVVRGAAMLPSVHESIKDVKRSCLYNGDEAPFRWRWIPSKGVFWKYESVKDIKGRKIRKERITVFPVVSADGEHFILILIGKAVKPACFTKQNPCPSYCKYYSQSSAWMSYEIFEDVFFNVFVPAVRKWHSSETRVVLLVDGGPHQPLQSIDNVTPHVDVVFLPPTCTCLVQPLDQGIISLMKRFYRKSLMRRVCSA